MTKSIQGNYKNLKFDNIDALRGTSGSRQGQSANILGYFAAGDAAGGPERVWSEGQSPGFYEDNNSSIITIGGLPSSEAWVYTTNNIYNALEWGCKNDGSTPNTLAIQNIIDIAGTTPSLIVLKGGVFVSDKLTIADDQHITFDGKNTGTLKIVDGATGLLIENSDTTFIDHFGLINITIDGNKSNKAAFTDTISVYVNTAEIRNVEFQRCQGKSIKFSHVNTFASITDSYFHDGAEHTGVVNEGSEYLSIRTDGTRPLVDGQTVVVSGNMFKGIVPTVSGRGVGGIIAAGNSSLLELEGHKLTITDNTLIDIGMDDIPTGNRVAAINLYRRAGASVIANNRVIGGYHKAIDVQGSANCVVANNVIRDMDPAFTEAAIAITSRDTPPNSKHSPRCIVIGNTIYNWGLGISAEQLEDDEMDGITIIGNYIQDVLQFIKLKNILHDISIKDNTFKDSTLATTSEDEQAITILIDSSVTPVVGDANINISGNNISNTGNSAINIAWAKGAMGITGNIFEKIGNIAVSIAGCSGPKTISGNAITDVGGKFIQAGLGTGSLNISSNTFDDSNGLIRSIQIQDGSCDTIISTNIFTNTPVTDLVNYDTMTGRNSLVGNIAPIGTLIRYTGGSTADMVSNNLF